MRREECLAPKTSDMSGGPPHLSPRPRSQVPRKKELAWKDLTSKRVFFLFFCSPALEPLTFGFSAPGWSGCCCYRRAAGMVLNLLLESVGVTGRKSLESVSREPNRR